MPQWPDGWREAMLRDASIPITQFALDVLSAWRKSTPTIPQTHNPLGMPAKGSGHPAYLSTPYALFQSPGHAREAFSRFLGTSKGIELRHVLVSAESLTDAWRAIHALPWPAKLTEDDYPAVLLDMVEQKYRDKIASRTKGKRKTAGTQNAPVAVHEGVKMQARALHNATYTLNDAAKAVRSIIREIG